MCSEDNKKGESGVGWTILYLFATETTKKN